MTDEQLLHPDDVVTLPGGLRVTSPERTVIDLADVLPMEELREIVERARRRGLLDLDALAAARARVEWRRSLADLDALIAELGDVLPALRRSPPPDSNR